MQNTECCSSALLLFALLNFSEVFQKGAEVYVVPGGGLGRSFARLQSAVWGGQVVEAGGQGGVALALRQDHQQTVQGVQQCYTILVIVKQV